MAENNHPGGQCDEIKKLIALLPEYVKRLERVEEKQETQDKTISELVTSHAETKVYVKMILEKLDGMEGNLFTYIKQAMKDANSERIAEKQLEHEEKQLDRKLDHEERKDGSQERITTTGQFLNVIKYVVGATVGALVAGVMVYLKLRG